MLKAYDNFIKLAIENLPQTDAAFQMLKKKLSGKLKLPIPTNADMRDRYEEMILQGALTKNSNFEKLLMSRKIRTQSGVAVVAVLTKSYPCPGKCLYCPTEKAMPKSYLSNEPAVMRAIHAKFNPYRQVQDRLRSLEINGHKTDKIELIVMGGTFSALPKRYQKQFIAECFRACNNYPNKNQLLNSLQLQKNETLNKKNVYLYKEQKRNEKAKHRIIGLTLETRPDYIDEKEIINFRNLGCTRVELGVQSIFDDVLKKNRRGHSVVATIEATKLLKNAGFKINYHMMPGLPGSDQKKDFKMFEELFSNDNFQPDMLKIYPTVVIKNSALYNLWKKKKYKALTDEQFERFIIKVKNELIPPYVRISRLVRDVPATSIVAGPKVSNLRQIISQKTNCPCIRCREVRADYEINEKIILDRINYKASDGYETFLQFTSPDKKKLFALLRLRVSQNQDHFISALKNSALIREVHTYGKMTEISKTQKDSPQHIGLGKKLILEAERIAKQEFGMKKIAVISGVGVREYYKKLGYKLQATYMVKNL
jgi:elongator complex protein 3